MKNVVLVHGAWHGAWCWERVLPLMAAAGVPTTAVDLPGHGDSTLPLKDLFGDAEHVSLHLDRLEGGVVLVGHSYGGAVITQAGTHPAVQHLVYFAAFPLKDGESAMAAATESPDIGHISHEGRPNLAAGFVAGPDDAITLDESVAAECFYGECDPVTVAGATARLGPQPAITLQQAPTEVAWRTTPSTYAVCARDLAVHPDLQRILARRCGSVVEWPTDHSPFLCRPDLVAGLLVSLAQE
ncbi:MAG TPA: alpha/beta fold hydrolase [Acidimicrobiales bacterium]|nr:alpha/beta fold hydrolase [Acidimicrobiales bacterium]